MRTCKRIMTANPVTCRMDDTLAEAAERMWRKDVGALPVVDEAGRLVGIVTDRDLAVRATSRGLAPGTSVREVMSRGVMTCGPEDPIEHAVERMEDRQVRRLPVVDDEGRLIGIIAQADLATRAHDRGLAAEFLEEVSDPAGTVWR